MGLWRGGRRYRGWAIGAMAGGVGREEVGGRVRVLRVLKSGRAFQFRPLGVPFPF